MSRVCLVLNRPDTIAWVIIHHQLLLVGSVINNCNPSVMGALWSLLTLWTWGRFLLVWLALNLCCFQLLIQPITISIVRAFPFYELNSKDLLKQEQFLFISQKYSQSKTVVFCFIHQQLCRYCWSWLGGHFVYIEWFYLLCTIPLMIRILALPSQLFNISFYCIKKLFSFQYIFIDYFQMFAIYTHNIDI